MKVWLDIDNPPQVQYLLPFKAAFAAAGADVVVTARDHTITLDLLRDQRADFHVVGHAFGRRRLQKVHGLVQRSRELVALSKQLGRPDLLLTGSRPAGVAARRLRIPSFNICDYEYSNLTVFRLTGTYILYPQVIGAEAFVRRGARADRLIPFRGLKEDITFSAVDPRSYPVHDFGTPEGLATVLFRPPAEESHYYKRGSRTLALDLLQHLAERDDAVVVFTPRYPRQAEYLKQYRWKNEPIELTRPVSFMSLLRGVDVVIASGGTMLREAAYLGIPAYSIFRSHIGGVDRYLQSTGRIGIVSSPRDFESLTFTNGSKPPPVERNAHLTQELVDVMLTTSGAQ